MIAVNLRCASLFGRPWFWKFAVLTFALVCVVLFMKRSVIEKGAHHAVE